MPVLNGYHQQLLDIEAHLFLQCGSADVWSLRLLHLLPHCAQPWSIRSSSLWSLWGVPRHTSTSNSLDQPRHSVHLLWPAHHNYVWLSSIRVLQRPYAFQVLLQPFIVVYAKEQLWMSLPTGFMLHNTDNYHRPAFLVVAMMILHRSNSLLLTLAPPLRHSRHTSSNSSHIWPHSTNWLISSR